MRALSNDLLPDCYDDWVGHEADAWLQLRVHALEALAGSARAARRFGEAATAATVAARAEPLRESARARSSGCTSPRATSRTRWRSSSAIAP